MGASPFHGNDSGPIGDNDFQSVVIAFHVKDDRIALQKTRGDVAIFDRLRGRPRADLNFHEPTRNPLARISMFGAKPVERFSPDYPHTEISAL
jgi:hypothetical protein